MVSQVHVEVYCQQRACKIRLFLKKKPTTSDGLSRWRAYSSVIVLSSAHLSSSDNILFIAYMLFIARSAFDEYTTALQKYRISSKLSQVRIWILLIECYL